MDINHQFGAFDGAEPSAIPRLLGALAEATKEFLPIEKNKEGKVVPKDPTKPGYSFKYAGLVSYVAATRDALAAQGLTVTSTPMRDEEGRQVVRMYLMHSGGGYMYAELGVPNIESDYITRVMQAFGTAAEFIRRILYKSLLNLVADDEFPDDDDMPEQLRADFTGGQQAGSYAKHPDLTSASSIGELSRVMQGFDKADKAKYSAHFNARQADLTEAGA